MFVFSFSDLYQAQTLKTNIVPKSFKPFGIDKKPINKGFQEYERNSQKEIWTVETLSDNRFW